MSVQQKDNLNLRELQQQLQQALVLIQQNNISKNPTITDDVQGLGNTQSLLQRCEQVVQQGQEQQKPILRMIHHFACSGGSLISKCIAAQPNVFLLSELHPTSRLGLPKGKAPYTPRDVITQAIYGRVPDVDTLAEQLFVQNILAAEKHIRERGGYLVVRAHTHADYCTDAELPDSDSLTRLLSPHFDLKQLVTVRNPIDSFLSLRQNGWVHFKPDSFDEYCQRLLAFISSFEKKIVVRYEDFVKNPNDEIKKICNILDIKTSDTYLSTFGIFSVSGDSGRVSESIEVRPRVCDKKEEEAFKSQEFFKMIEKQFGY